MTSVGTFVVTEVVDGKAVSVHFACALSPEKARSLVARRIRVPEEALNVVLLRRDEGGNPRDQRSGRQAVAERYLGPLSAFSPRLQKPCIVCRGSGRIIGDEGAPACTPCGGTGFRPTGRS